jgi:hypothetical protein
MLWRRADRPYVVIEAKDHTHSLNAGIGAGH